jgi:Uma2 family endonuclease
MFFIIEDPTDDVVPQVRSRRGDPTWEVAYFFPRQGEWTEREYLALNTNWFIELTQGCLEFPPMPTAAHHLIVGFLIKPLSDFVTTRGLGVAVFGPLPVRLWKGKYRMPDIMFLRPHHIPDVHSQPNGAALVMEIISPGEESRRRDLVIKRNEYAHAGIDEYWIIDPEEQSITVLVRDRQTYREHGVFTPGQQATSVTLTGFVVDVTATFAAGNAIPPAPSAAAE